MCAVNSEELMEEKSETDFLFHNKRIFPIQSEVNSKSMH